MLKGIPSIIPPDLLAILMAMGHGDQLVLADGNFPATGLARRLVRADGHGVPPLLDAILRFFPLDTYVRQSAALMAVVPGDEARTDIWEEYTHILKHWEPSFDGFEMLERFTFYDRARSAYAIVATSEQAIYANIIITKGLVKQ
jgi:L-fucose mutarotase